MNNNAFACKNALLFIKILELLIGLFIKQNKSGINFGLKDNRCVTGKTRH